MLNKLSNGLLGIIFLILSALAMIASTAISILCYSQLASNETQRLIINLFLIILQLVVYIGSISKSAIIKNIPQHYKLLNIFTYFCFILSVLSTITYFNQFDKNARYEVIQDLLNIIPFINLDSNNWLVGNLTNITLVWLSAFILDLISMYFPSIGADLLTGNKIKNIKIQDSLFSKLIYVLTFKPVYYINSKYNDLQKLTNDFQDMDKSNDKSNDLKDDLTIEKSFKIAPPQEKQAIGFKYDNDNMVKSSDFQDVEKIDNDFLDLKNNDLCKITDFIQSKYKINEQIKTGEIKKEFNISSNEWQRKYKNDLDCIKCENRKFYRIK